MTAFKRNMKYWGYTVEVLVLTVIGMAILLGLFRGAMEGWQIGLTYMAGFMPTLCGIGVCMMGYVGVSTYFPFSLSLGATRKASFAGMQVMVHAMTLQLMLLWLAVNMLQERMFADGTPYKICHYLFFFFFPAGICNGTSIFCLRFSRKVATVAYILFVVVSAIGFEVVLNIYEIETISLAVQYICMGLSVVFDLLMAFICFLSIRKYEVRV